MKTEKWDYILSESLDQQHFCSRAIEQVLEMNLHRVRIQWLELPSLMTPASAPYMGLLAAYKTWVTPAFLEMMFLEDIVGGWQVGQEKEGTA